MSPPNKCPNYISKRAINYRYSSHEHFYSIIYILRHNCREHGPFFTSTNLLFVSKITDENYNVVFDKKQCLIKRL